MVAASPVSPSPHAQATAPRSRGSQRVLPGFGLTLGYTLFYLSIIVLVPLLALIFKSFDLTWDQFWEAVSAPRVVASYKLTFGASLAAACVNLGFDHPHFTAEGFRCLNGVFDAGAVDTARNTDAEFLQDLLALIFVNFHALSLRLVELRAMSSSRNSPDPARLYRLELKMLPHSKKIIAGQNS